MPVFHKSRHCGYCCLLAQRLNTFNEVYLHDYYYYYFILLYCVYFLRSSIKLRYVTDCTTIMMHLPPLFWLLHQNYYVA